MEPTIHHSKLGLVVPTLVFAAMMFGVQYGLRQAFPSSASAANKAAQKATEAEKTEGRSSLARIRAAGGAITFWAREADGSLLYAWQTGRRLDVRVDVSPKRCSGGSWRERWWTSDRPGIVLEADGSFFDRHHEVAPISSGGVDVADSTVEGSIRHGILTLVFRSRDDYRGAYYNDVCRRVETFSARRSG